MPGVLLLCLDVQTPLVAVMAEPARLLRRCGLAIAAAQGLGVTTAFTEQVPRKLGPIVDELVALAPDATRFPKTSFSALADPAISNFVREHDIEHILLAGLETPICVYQTAIDALNTNLQVTVLSDAVGARRPDDAAVALSALTRAGAHVLPTETVLYSLVHDAKHPFFKRLTQLVKTHG